MSPRAGAPVVLSDTMIVIEAVRTGVWRAITGQRTVVTVETCAGELRRGDFERQGYVRVSEEDIARAEVVLVPPVADARFRLAYVEAGGMDAGERHLLAHAHTRGDAFELCSADKAAVRAAHRLGWLDRLVSLEGLARSVGARPAPALKVQFTDVRLGQWRAALTLGQPI